MPLAYHLIMNALLESDVTGRDGLVGFESVTDLQGLAIVDLGVPSVGKIGIDHEIVDDQIRDISDLDAA